MANALDPPAGWTAAFDFVFEAYTIQVLWGEARAACARSLGRMVAPGGVLLAVARSRRVEDPAGAMPWPLTRAELDAFLVPGLRLAGLTEIVEPGDPPVPRFVAEFVAGAARVHCDPSILSSANLHVPFRPAHPSPNLHSASIRAPPPVHPDVRTRLLLNRRPGGPCRRFVGAATCGVRRAQQENQR